MTRLEADKLLEAIAELKGEIASEEKERDTLIEYYETKIAKARDICDKATREARISQRRKDQYAQMERRKCEMCGAEFHPQSSRQLMCAKCIREERQKKELVTKAVAQAEKKPVKEPEEWVREADECGIDYGTYRGLVTVFGKTHEEIKAQYGGSVETAHAHAGQSTRRAGGAMGVKLA